eukprot:TRINITY_DN4147_c3_g1_i1.p1 TRINITY_DN4147_c3_g1~~TRINITY_DN4147_c3_g1_i1.p1  ORF type:complete len:176 (-),score=50.22 TRINITY_DN4147_c3_g1_i1:254-742(-)
MALDLGESSDSLHPCKVFVGNLPFSLNQEGFARLFRPIGDVVGAKLVEDRTTGKKKGFGFITFNKPESADAAISQMHGREVEGRPLTVKRATNRGQKGDDRDDEEDAEDVAESSAAADDDGFASVPMKKKGGRGGGFRAKAEAQQRETGKLPGWGGGDDDWA